MTFKFKYLKHNIKHDMKHILKHNIRPITLNVILKTLKLLNQRCTLEEFVAKSGFTEKRAKEIINQLQDMELIENSQGTYSLTEKGEKLLKALENGNVTVAHEIMMKYKPYRQAYKLLKTRKHTYTELALKIGVSPAAVDILLRLMKKCGIEIVEDEDNLFYIPRDESEISYAEFVKTLLKKYRELAHIDKYVKIPELRNKVCRETMLSHKSFDSLLKKFIKNSMEKGLVTLSPPLASTMKDKGIKIRNRHYYYIYINLKNAR